MGFPFGTHNAAGQGKCLAAIHWTESKKVGLSWINFQAVQRTHASMMSTLGVEGNS
jgi:hypothetical protein